MNNTFRGLLLRAATMVTPLALLLAVCAFFYFAGTGVLASTPSSSVRLNNYSNWTWPLPTDKNYSTEVMELAQRDYVDMSETYTHWSTLTPAKLTAVNSAAKVYRYYTLLMKGPTDSDWKQTASPTNDWGLQLPIYYSDIVANNWWLRDGNGNIVIGDDGTYVVDVGKPGFKQKYLANVLSRNAGLKFNGFVVDDMRPLAISNWVIGRGLPPPVSYPTDTAWYTNAWQPFLTYIISGLHAAGYQVIGNNGGEYGTTSIYQQWQRTVLDGTVYEQGAVDWDFNGSGWLPGSAIATRIIALQKDPLPIWFANQGLMPGITDYDAKKLVSLAMYYIGIPTSSQANRSYGYAYNWSVFFDPMWNFNIGTPAELAVQQVRGGVPKYAWRRRYTDGYVLLNYEATDSITFTTLDKPYREPDGTVVTNPVTLAPHTALILGPD